MGVWGLGKFRVYAWSNIVSNLRYATCPNHRSYFGIILDSAWDLRTKIQDCPGVSPRNLGSWIPARVKNDSKMTRMIRACKQIIWVFEGGALNHPNHFGTLFDSGPARIIRIILESCLIRAWIQDPRSKIPGRSSQGILDPVLARIIRIILEPFLTRAGIQDPRFLGETPGQSWILVLRSQAESKMIPK